MSVEDIKDLINDKLANYKAMHMLMKDDYGKGAIEALEGLLHDIEDGQ